MVDCISQTIESSNRNFFIEELYFISDWYGGRGLFLMFRSLFNWQVNDLCPPIRLGDYML